LDESVEPSSTTKSSPGGIDCSRNDWTERTMVSSLLQHGTYAEMLAGCTCLSTLIDFYFSFRIMKYQLIGCGLPSSIKDSSRRLENNFLTSTSVSGKSLMKRFILLIRSMSWLESNHSHNSLEHRSFTSGSIQDFCSPGTPSPAALFQIRQRSSG
jgi:hypothetical protein